METLNFIGLVIAVWLVAEGAAPIQWFKKLLNIHEQTKSENLWTRFFMKLFNCSMCLGFWFGLVYYWSSWEMACIVSFTAEIFHRLCRRYL